MSEPRELSYGEALAEATVQAMERDPRLFVMGEGVDDCKGAFGTTLSAHRRFGGARVFDTPLSEAAVTGIGIGAALEGYPCLMVHMRSEFLLVAMDQVVNHAAKWRYMSGGALSVPIVIRCIVGRGWGQAAQHSQSLHGLFAQVPGLKVVAPAGAYDAKGLLLAALSDGNPVLMFEPRPLYETRQAVPEAIYEVPLGSARICRPGKDLTCVAISSQVRDALAAAVLLREQGIEMEVIDPRTLRPLDTRAVLASLRKTGRLLVLDPAPQFAGYSAEIAALAADAGFSYLRAPVKRVAFPEAPTPCSHALEQCYYPSVETVVRAAGDVVRYAQGSSERRARPTASDELPA